MGNYKQLHESTNLPVGILLTTIAWILFAALSACIKAINQEIPTHQILFFQAFFALLLFTPSICIEPSILKTKATPKILLRTLFGLTTYYLFIYAVQRIPLVDATVLFNTAPFFIPFILLVFIKKPIPLKQLLAIFVGFSGVVVILHPGAEIFSYASILALLSGFFGAASLCTTRLLSSESPITIVFYYLLFSTIVFFPFLFVNWTPPSLKIWILLIASGALMNFLTVMYTQAYKYACPSDLGPFIYSAVVAATIIGWIFWGEIPSIITYIGMGLVIFGGTLTILFSPSKTPK